MIMHKINTVKQAWEAGVTGEQVRQENMRIAEDMFIHNLAVCLHFYFMQISYAFQFKHN